MGTNKEVRLTIHSKINNICRVLFCRFRLMGHKMYMLFLKANSKGLVL